MTQADIVNKLWGYCHVLKHDGIDYSDYIEQLTFLLFLKMADERGAEVPKKYNWANLKDLSGTELTDHYGETLRKLRESSGILGDIFTQAVSRFNNPVNLKRVISMIDEEHWSEMDVDVKAAAFEGLLEKAASEGKKGAGQYFTPRPLIQSIVRVMKPDPRGQVDFKVCDPACGTGGFLVAAYEWLLTTSKEILDRKDIKRIKTATYYGQDLVPRPRRLALMNLFLHGIEPTIYLGDAIYEPDRGEQYNVILTNPPFGTRGANQAPDREDFTIETSNKQLNFVQHVVKILKPGGRAAMVLPDNCLDEGKAGEIFKLMMEDCNLHTILRLPRGTFTPYSQGVKANVFFFQKGLPTENIWIYDARSNVPGITKKDRPLTPEHFTEFEKCYGTDPNGQGKRKDLGDKERFRKFHIGEVKKRNYKLDIAWLKDETLDEDSDIPEPTELVSDAISELEIVIKELKQIPRLVAGVDKEDSTGLPRGWTSCKVREAFSSFGGGTPDRTNAGYWHGNIPWLSSGDIKADLIEGSSETITKAGLDNSSTRLCRAGSVVVVVRSGILKHTLPVAILKKEAAINQDIKCFDSGHNSFNRWLFLAFKSSVSTILARNRDGTTVQSVRSETLLDFLLPVPPLKEQERIIARLDELLSKVQDCQECLEKATSMLVGARSNTNETAMNYLAQSIFMKAFRGQIVAQDPREEPASVLIDKIRAKGDIPSPRRRRTSLV